MEELILCDMNIDLILTKISIPVEHYSDIYLPGAYRPLKEHETDNPNFTLLETSPYKRKIPQG